MSYISRIGQSLILSAALFATSCVNEVMENAPEQGNAPETSVMTKIINTPSDSEDGTLLLYLSKEAAANFHKGQRIASQTPEGMEVRSFKPIFNMTEQNEKYMRKHQLDRWFIMEFEGMGLDNAAKTLAQFGEVSRVQFNKFVTYGSDVKSAAPAEEQPEVADNVFNDPRLADQWHYNNTGSKIISTAAVAGEDIAVNDVWRELTGGDSEIVVAIIDGPVKYTHEDLKDNMWVNTAEKNGEPGVDDDNNGYVDDIYGWNCDQNNGSINWKAPNESGHGTHVAGIVGAVNNNGRGVCGVAGGTGNGDGVRLMGCQIFTGGTSSNTAAAAIAFVYAADNGAHIAQCSFGYQNGTYGSDYEYYQNYSVEYFAIRYFMDTERFAAVDNGRTKIIDGPLVIFAAGNDSFGSASYPGALRDCICVTGLGPDGYPASYTNYGPGCNIAAPGGDYYLNTETSRSRVLSTFVSEVGSKYGDYTYMDGTSMACPHVSGVAALGLAYAKKLGKTFTRDEFTAMLLSSVNDLDTKLSAGYKFLGYDSSTGAELPMRPYSTYQHKMGTGSIDAWKFMMNIEGTPSLMVKVGEEGRYSLKNFFGGAADRMSYASVEMSSADMKALGITSKPKIVNGQLVIEPSKVGSAKITIKAIAGGDKVAGTQSGDWTGNGDIVTLPKDDGIVGGMYITKEISILSRGVSSDNGGWL